MGPRANSTRIHHQGKSSMIIWVNPSYFFFLCFVCYCFGSREKNIVVYHPCLSWIKGKKYKGFITYPYEGNIHNTWVICRVGLPKWQWNYGACNLKLILLLDFFSWFWKHIAMWLPARIFPGNPYLFGSTYVSKCGTLGSISIDSL